MSPANSDSSGENSIAHDGGGGGKPSRYESQKRRDWNTFRQYLLNHRPPLELGRCSGAHVLEFLRYLDQFGKTKVHAASCPFFGLPQPPAPCPCPLRQAWGSLDALVGRLRAAFEEDGGLPEANPFAARAVRLYLRDVRDSQAKARGIAHDKKKRKRPLPPSPPQPTIPLAARAMAAVLPATIGQRVLAPAADLNLVINGGYAQHLAIPSMDADGDDAAAIAEAQYSGGMIPLSVFN